MSGFTRAYAVLGHPIGHTLSPVMHNAAFQSLGMDAIYLAFDVLPDRLMDVLKALRDMGFGGVNLTIPLKQVAFEHLSELDASACALGAVNTVEFLPSGGIKGHNTDGVGFVAAIEEAFGVSLRGLSVFVLGAGGAGRAVAFSCAGHGEQVGQVAGQVARQIWLSDLDSGRAQHLCKQIRGQAPQVEVQVVQAEREAWKRACAASDLVVQATPVGMDKDDPPLLEPEAFRRGQMAYDLVYVYPETAFMKAARMGGAKTANGIGMLLHQGARAFAIWTGRPAATEAMRQALQAEAYAS